MTNKIMVVPPDGQPFFVEISNGDYVNREAEKQILALSPDLTDLPMGLDHGMLNDGTGGVFVRGDGWLTNPRPNMLATMLAGWAVSDVAVFFACDRDTGATTDAYWDDPDSSILGMVHRNHLELTSWVTNGPPVPTIIDPSDLMGDEPAF